MKNLSKGIKINLSNRWKIFLSFIAFLIFSFFWFIGARLYNTNLVHANSWGAKSLTDFFSNWKIGMDTFYYPITITLFTTEEAVKNHDVSITMYDGETHPKYEAVRNQSIAFNKGVAEILVPINTKKIKIDKDILVSIVVDGVQMGQLKLHMLWLYTDYSKDTDAIMETTWAIVKSDGLIAKSDFENLVNELISDLNNTDQLIPKKDLINKYTRLRNGKINIDAIPFWMNNLTCNITAEDIQYLEQNFPSIQINKSKITLNKVCKDWMTDFHQLVQNIRAYKKDQELLKNYKEKGNN